MLQLKVNFSKKDGGMLLVNVCPIISECGEEELQKLS